MIMIMIIIIIIVVIIVIIIIIIICCCCHYHDQGYDHDYQYHYYCCSTESCGVQAYLSGIRLNSITHCHGHQGRMLIWDCMLARGADVGVRCQGTHPGPAQPHSNLTSLTEKDLAADTKGHRAGDRQAGLCAEWI